MVCVCKNEIKLDDSVEFQYQNADTYKRIQEIDSTYFVHKIQKVSDSLWVKI